VTYTEYVTTLAGLSVAGVVKTYTAPPTQMNTAQLPAQWVRLPSGETQVVTLAGGVGIPSFSCDLVIAVEAVSQNTQPVNYAKALALLDALQATLTTEALDGVADSWSLRLDSEQIGTAWYWVIVATVTGSE